MICPKDMKPCCDDLCYSGTCLCMPGVMPYEHCDGCGALVSEDDHDACTCEPFYDEEEPKS